MRKDSDIIYITRNIDKVTLDVQGVKFNVSPNVYDLFDALKKNGINRTHNIADLRNNTLITIHKYDEEYGKLIVHRLSSTDRVKKECVFNPYKGIAIYDVDDTDYIRIKYSKNTTKFVEKEKLEHIAYKTKFATAGDKIKVNLKIYPISDGCLLELNDVSYYIPSYDIFNDLMIASNSSYDKPMSYILNEIDGDEQWILKVTNTKIDAVKLVFEKRDTHTWHFVFLDIDMINEIYEYMKDALLYLSIAPK